MFVRFTLVILVNKYKFSSRSFRLYGFVAIIAVAIIYSYRVQMKHRLYLLYGLGSLFIAGLGSGHAGRPVPLDGFRHALTVRARIHSSRTGEDCESLTLHNAIAISSHRLTISG